tara:strand:+ start:606 stop:1334 length:729 start_codon:yes stop_codon:yes gene_type:complete
MAFKQKGYPMHKGTASHREASAVFQKTTTMVGGQADHDPQEVAAKSAKDKKAYGGTKTWKEGSTSAKSTTGMSLNQLVAARGKTKKGSSEYNRIQNEINKALGSKTRHEVDSKKTKVGDIKIKDKRGGAEAGGKTVISGKTEEGRTRVVTDPEGVKRSVSVTGKDTPTKEDDVKKVARRTKEGGTATRTRTATDVSKTRTDAEGETTKSTTRKRLGKGGLKEAAAKAKAKRAAKKAAKTAGK